MKSEIEGRAAAKRFRSSHLLGVQPLGDLVTVIEQATGFDVAVLDAGPDEHGLAMRDPQRETVFICVARTRHPMRQRSTLAHELGHVLFGDWGERNAGNWSDQTPEEQRCRAFARHLLVPVEGVQKFLGDRHDVTPAVLSAVVQRFLVSPAIAAITLEEAGYIAAVTRHKWSQIYTRRLAARFGWSDQYHALQNESDQRRAPQRLLARVVTGYVEGVVSAQAIATLRGITVDKAEAELREAGIEPEDRDVAWAEASELPEVDVDLDLDAEDTASEREAE